jgi:acetyl-CoA carboxylase carboxyltransferase component
MTRTPPSGDALIAHRSDLDALLRAQAARLDAQRPAAVERQRQRGRWTVREVVDALVDPHTFVEYGGLAQPATEGMTGAADGLVMGTARVGGQAADLVLYDYTVYAGTQSAINHMKMTRMFEHALRFRLPVICWLDGGGARPHDMLLAARGKTPTFVVFARLSGHVPTIGVVPGAAFAGQANLAGMCDLLIGVRGSAMGMAGPPLVEAALGVRYTPQEIGATEFHEQSGVYDLVADNDAQAVELAQRYLGYFGPAQSCAGAADQSLLRDLVPENPRQSYDVRRVIETLADTGSVLELKPVFGACIVTAFIRLDGRAVGVIANQPLQLAGAIDSAGSVKAARFASICDAFDIPLLLLCDTPGLMVGPEAEKTGLVRHSARLLTAIANATTPLLTVVLRKAYGLGYYIMGSQPLDPAILLAWPTAEYGGMGLEGAVNIIYRRELEAIVDAQERAQLHARLTAELKEEHSAIVAGSRFTYDDVIDPADTRELLLRTLESLPPPALRVTRKRLIEPF